MRKTDSYASFKDSPHYCLKITTYFEAYDKLFAEYRDKEITFVEIGLLHGGSLFMWRDFFGPKARIIGIDINPDVKKWEAEGFEIFVGDQGDKNFWKDFIEKIGPVDVVLDDGGHTYPQQIITTEMLLDNINDGGVLVIEDTHTSYMDGYGDKQSTFLSYVKMLIDMINLRFGPLESKVSETRMWSISIYESIVAFHINKKASSRLSRYVENVKVPGRKK